MNRQSLAEKIVALKQAKGDFVARVSGGNRTLTRICHRGFPGSDVANCGRGAEDRTSSWPQRR